MTPAEFATLVRLKTRTNSTTFPDADMLALMKARQFEIARAILSTDEDILLIPQTTSLVANVREYPFPLDMLNKIKRVEAKLDGTNWIKLAEKDITELNYALTEANITQHFSNNEGYAFYDISRRSFYILSGTITSVTDGLKAWVYTYPTAITDLTSSTDMSQDPSTTTHGIPYELHEIWSRGVVIDYKSSREKPIPLTESELRYEFDKKEAINSIRITDKDHEILGRLPVASTRGDNGYNY